MRLCVGGGSPAGTTKWANDNGGQVVGRQPHPHLCQLGYGLAQCLVQMAWISTTPKTPSSMFLVAEYPFQTYFYQACFHAAQVATLLDVAQSAPTI